MAEQQKPGFYISRGKGFHITFENGWTASVQFGGGNYSDNYREDISEEAHRESGERGSGCAEIAAWSASDVWHQFQKDGYTDEVNGYVRPAEVLAFLNEIAAKPRA